MKVKFRGIKYEFYLNVLSLHMTNKYCLLFLLFQSHLVDWMHEVMHKDPVDYEYRRADLRWNPATFAKAATSSFLPFGLGNKYFRAPTLERLERVRYLDF